MVVLTCPPFPSDSHPLSQNLTDLSLIGTVIIRLPFNLRLVDQSNLLGLSRKSIPIFIKRVFR